MRNISSYLGIASFVISFIPGGQVAAVATSLATLGIDLAGYLGVNIDTQMGWYYIPSMHIVFCLPGISVNNGWLDDFESYTTGAFPSANWTVSGNTSDSYVDNTRSKFGSKSLKLYGVIGGCWGSIAYRKLNITAPYYIEFYAYNGSESLSGCHPQRATVELKTGTSWTNDGRWLGGFESNGAFKTASGSVLGIYPNGVWYKVKIKYEIVSSFTIRLTYWIDDVLKGSEDLSAFAYENNLTYVGIASQEGTAWFDDVSVHP